MLPCRARRDQHGHSRTTREIYTHVSEPMMEQAAEAITAAVEEANDGAAGSNGSKQWVQDSG